METTENVRMTRKLTVTQQKVLVKDGESAFNEFLQHLEKVKPLIRDLASAWNDASDLLGSFSGARFRTIIVGQIRGYIDGVVEQKIQRIEAPLRNSYQEYFERLTSNIISISNEINQQNLSQENWYRNQWPHKARSMQEWPVDHDGNVLLDPYQLREEFNKYLDSNGQIQAYNALLEVESELNKAIEIIQRHNPGMLGLDLWKIIKYSFQTDRFELQKDLTPIFFIQNNID